MSHACRYRERLEWSDWTREGPLRRREARRVPRCELCGKARPPRKPRRAVGLEIEAGSPVLPAIMDPAAQHLAGKLLVKAGRKDAGPGKVGMKGLLSSLKLPASQAEELLDELLCAGWVRLYFKLKGSRKYLSEITVIDFEGLENFSKPGLREARRTAIAEALDDLNDLEHPVAEKVRLVISGPEADHLDPEVLQALSSLALFAENGETCARRVFSARYLGDSKALDRLLVRLERMIGPLEDIGIREGAALVLVGGNGRIDIAGQPLFIDRLPPFVGLPRDTAMEHSGMRFPDDGLLVVENLAVFEACCRGEVAGVGEALVVWSAGYPGRAVRMFVKTAGRLRRSIRIWADLDLDGIRIARLIHQWSAGKALPWRMGPEDLAAAHSTRPLSSRSAAAIRTDIQAHPEGLLRETLEAILEKGRWVEQEALLALPSDKE